MLDRNDIVLGIQTALESVSKKAKSAEQRDLESTKWWTRNVLHAICQWGLGNGLFVCASGMAVEAEMNKLAQEKGGTIHGEWLYDLTCLTYEEGWLQRIVLVAECEWGNRHQIDDDFQKLLLARADVRLMIFNGNWYRDDEAPSREHKTPIQSGVPEEFLGHIERCEHTRLGDTYLFAARLHDSGVEGPDCHRFVHHRFTL